MAYPQWKATATRPFLIASDIERSVVFYERIGFEETFRNDVVYSLLEFGGIFTHLGTRMEYAGARKSQALTEMEDIDEYYALCKLQNATVEKETGNRFYWLRTFNLGNIGGNIIEFA